MAARRFLEDYPAPTSTPPQQQGPPYGNSFSTESPLGRLLGLYAQFSDPQQVISTAGGFYGGMLGSALSGAGDYLTTDPVMAAAQKQQLEQQAQTNQEADQPQSRPESWDRLYGLGVTPTEAHNKQMLERARAGDAEMAARRTEQPAGAVEFAPGQFYKGPDRVTGSARPDSFSTGVRRGRDLAKSVGKEPGSLYGGQGKLKPASFGKGTVTNLISNDIVPNHPEARREYYQQKAATEQAIADAATAAQNREYTTETPLEERAETAARVEALKRPPDYRVLQINEIRTMLIPKLKQALDAGDDKLTAAVIQEYLDRISNIGSNQGYFPGSFPEPTS